MKNRDLILAAADLIEGEGRWTQGYTARNEYGQPVSNGHMEAVCWCAIGALRRVSGEENLENIVAVKLGLNCSPIGKPHPLAAFNDAENRSQSEVVSALRRAAELVD